MPQIPRQMTTIIPFTYPVPMGNGFGFYGGLDRGIPSIPFFPKFSPEGVGGPIFPQKMSNLTKGWPHNRTSPMDIDVPFPFHDQRFELKFPMPVPLASSRPRLAKQIYIDFETLLGYITNSTNYYTPNQPSYITAPRPIQPVPV
jgi:hypothetical protein